MSKGITGSELAKMAEISPAYLSEVERGLSEVSGEKLLRIAGSLGVSMQGLLEGTASQQSQSEVAFPVALAEAADQLGWSYRTMASLHAAKQSLVARRSSIEREDWSVEDWIEFHDKVKDYLEPRMES
jgi:transcriptional regulator with XRE-family HTH domain